MNPATFITRRVAVGLVLVSALSLLAFLVLSAYAPDLRPETSGGGNALSKSAIGYAGLRLLTDSMNVPSTVRRNPVPCDNCSLLVLAPEGFSTAAEVDRLSHPGPRLIVLPKWITTGDYAHTGWAMKVGAFDHTLVAKLLSVVAKGAKIEQARRAGRVRLTARDHRFEGSLPAAAISVDKLQTISGKNLEPKIVDGNGKAVLVQIVGTQIYVLADPDFLSNHGLHDIAVARMAFAMVDTIRVGDTPVTFDVTLNGFRKSPDLLREVFSPPFLGATLCAILAAAFIAFHALSRFGSPQRKDRVFAFGKRALADNTAAVIRLMRREPQMAPRYAQAMLHLVATQAGVPRERSSDPGWIATLEKRNAVPLRFAELNAEAGSVHDTYGLVRVAEKLYRWRRGILHERQ